MKKKIKLCELVLKFKRLWLLMNENGVIVDVFYLRLICYVLIYYEMYSYFLYIDDIFNVWGFFY